jgi:site-specific recombinase XerD
MSVGTDNPFFAEPYALRRWMSGPLSPYLGGFATRLHEYGYSPGVGQDYVRCVGYLSVWLDHKGLEASQLDEYKIYDYLRTLKSRRHTVISGAPHRLFLSYLREIGIIKRPPPQAASKIDCVVNDYLEYLRQVRGLAESTLPHRRLFSRRFLEERFGNQPVRLSRLKAQDVIQYIQGHAHEYGVLYRATMVLILRDFCRFLQLRGHIRKDVASSIPRVPYWKATRRPDHLTNSDIERLLKNCERKTPKGIRDYAILLFLVRLGMRAGEVRNLALEDIDWETGQITACGKASKRKRLPLPYDVGQALAEYLKHGRPPSSSRCVFLRMRAPYTGMACSGAIYKIVQGALRRAGLNPSRQGPHLLRHSFATHLLRSGASLADVGRMLGHDDVNSTLVYARIDANQLKMVIQPWPGGVS